MRSTLASGEDGGVDSRFEIGLLVLSEEDKTGSGTPQSLVATREKQVAPDQLHWSSKLGTLEHGTGAEAQDVRGGGDYVAVLERRVLDFTSNETRDVSHIRQEVSTLLVGDASKGLVVPISGVGRCSADDETGLEEVGVGSEGFIVDQTGLLDDLVWKGLEVDG